MKIEGYQYITHAIIPRPWGIECRYTVADQDGNHINDIVMLSDGKEDEETIAEKILYKLQSQAAVEEEPPAKLYTEDEVNELLRDAWVLRVGETIKSLEDRRLKNG